MTTDAKISVTVDDNDWPSGRGKPKTVIPEAIQNLLAQAVSTGNSLRVQTSSDQIEDVRRLLRIHARHTENKIAFTDTADGDKPNTSCFRFKASAK